MSQVNTQHGMNQSSLATRAALDGGEITGAQTSGPGQYLTIDSLMSYCQSRIQWLDAQAQQVFQQQQKAIDDSTALNDLRAALDSLTGGIDTGGRAAHDIVRAYQAAINKVGADTPLGHKLTQERDAFIDKVSPGGQLRADMSQPDFWTRDLAPNADNNMVTKLSPEDTKVFATSIKGIQDDLGHTSELNMVNLQSVMSQRQMAIQVVTNLVQSLGDMANKIAANIGH